MELITGRYERDGEGRNVYAERFERLKLKVGTEKPTANCERNDVVGKLVERVNGDGKKFAPKSFRQFCGLLAPLSLPELYELLKACESARSFGAMFWFRVRDRRRKLSTGCPLTRTPRRV